MKFYKCDKCDEIIVSLGKNESALDNSGFKEVKANSKEAANEKHLPKVERENDLIKVSVGEVLHPMTEEHYIQWVILELENGFEKVDLNPNVQPIVEFKLSQNSKPVAVYEYCNLHGIWKTELN